MSGDLETTAAALDGLDTDGGADDADILLTRGKYAFFTSDFDGGRGGRRGGPAAGAGRRARTGRCSTSWRCRGCWRTDRGTGSTGCASSCTARGRTRRSPTRSSTATCARPSTCSTARRPTPKSSAWPATCSRPPSAAGALRAAAFASALIGEAALLSGDLELAAAELTEASDLHRDLGLGGGARRTRCSGSPRCEWPRETAIAATRLLHAGAAAGAVVDHRQAISCNGSSAR